MAPRQTARRLLVAAPALALAFAVTACSPPNEQPADPDAPYTLPTYSEEPKAESHEAEETTAEESSEVETTATEETTDPAGTAGGPEAPGAPEAPAAPEQQQIPALPGEQPAQP